MRNLFCCTVILMSLVFATGCERGGGVKYSEVSGTITMDGEPVKTGGIEFSTAEGPDVGAGSCDIVDGKYSLKVVPGEKIVRIEVRKVIGQRLADPEVDTLMIDDTVKVAFEKYWDKSELRATVKNGKNSNVDFDLTSDEKK